jgi:hypothetical protein
MSRHRSFARMGLLLLVLATSHAAAARGEDAFYSVRISDVALTEGKLPEYDLSPTNQLPFPFPRQIPAPYVALDGDGEAVVEMMNRFAPWSFTQQDLLEATILVRVPEKREITGRLYVPKPDLQGFVVTRFRIPADKADAAFHDAFYQAQVAEYQALQSANVPGAAWFRHELREAQRELNQAPQAPAANGDDFNTFGGTELDDTYALFSGGRALSENLALDRGVAPTNDIGQMTVEMSSIAGITIAEIDWTKLIEGKKPELDALAGKIPADQHAVFFPSFDAFVTAIDELKANSAPILRLTEPRAEDARSVARYEKQLGVPLTSAARLLGGQVVKSVALTGGDPYFRVGTDVAFLFETERPEVLRDLLWVQMKLNAQGVEGVKERSGKYGATAYQGLRSEDRTVSGYVAALPGAVLLTNSPYQLERASAVQDATAPALVSLDEFTFFRDRYPRGAEDETAFVFLSDATIRRWCGPHWRIAGSRRTRDMAVVAELQAAHLEKIVRGEVRPGAIYTDLAMASAGELMLETTGVRSPVYNTLAFQTPISELAMEKVTAEEAAAYGRWRDGYQRNWRWAFDPIGVKLTLKKELLGADMTVMPLIASSDYAPLISITRGGKIPEGAGDPHDTLAHAILAINRDALPVRQYAGLATAMSPGAKVDVLSWLGDTVGLYLDPDPFWGELMDPKLKNEDRERLLRDKGFSLPLAIHADSKSNLKLAAFLTGLRAFVEQTAPGMTTWDSLTHGELPYVRIGSTQRAGQSGVPDNAAVYYGVIGDMLVLTPNEDVMKRAIDRQLAREAAKAKGETVAVTHPWLGENVALQADRAAADAAYAISGDQYRAQMQQLSWANLPILNAWHRLFPDQDPVKVHETYWQARLVCPGGGEYVWNDEYQTMESTVFGSPANPKPGVVLASPLDQLKRGNFGLTFEPQGLRARVELDRAVKEKK